MKRIKNIFCLFVIMALVLMPIQADAMAISWEGAPACATPDAEGYCETTVYLLYQKDSANEAVSAWGGTLTLKDANAASGIKDLTVSSVDSTKYTVTYTGNVASGTGALAVTTVDSSALSNTKATRVVKITYKHAQSLATQGIDCGLKFVLSGKQEETVTPETPKNTKTGASLPYAILGVGAVGAIAIYAIVNKKSKLHNI